MPHVIIGNVPRQWIELGFDSRHLAAILPLRLRAAFLDSEVPRIETEADITVSFGSSAAIPDDKTIIIDEPFDVNRGVFRKYTPSKK